jgi:hypothetical protein
LTAAATTAKAGTERRRTGGELGEGVKEVANRRALRFLGSGPEPEDPVTPQGRRRAANPGDSADSPQVID